MALEIFIEPTLLLITDYDQQSRSRAPWSRFARKVLLIWIKPI